MQQYQKPAPTPAEAAAAGAPTATPSATALARRPGQSAIAVLPFANMSGRDDQEYFADGMTEAITADLSQGGRTDGDLTHFGGPLYKTTPASTPEIAKALGVDLVVEGSVLQSGDQVRVTPS